MLVGVSSIVHRRVCCGDVDNGAFRENIYRGGVTLVPEKCHPSFGRRLLSLSIAGADECCSDLGGGRVIYLDAKLRMDADHLNERFGNGDIV